MILVDYQSKISTYIETHRLNDELSFINLNIDTFDFANGLEDELVFIHYEYLNREAVKLKLSACKIVVVFGGDSAPTTNTVMSVQEKSNPAVIRNFFRLFDRMVRSEQVMHSQLLTINSELGQLMGDVELELLKIKSVYESYAPKRHQSFRTIDIHSKYAAGNKIGGEFFDIVDSGKSIYGIMSSTNSYLASSSVMQVFSDFKEKLDKNIDELYVQIFSEIEKVNQGRAKDVELSLYIYRIDEDTLSIEGISCGNFYFGTGRDDTVFLSTEYQDPQGRLNYEVERKSLKLNGKISKGERVVFYSPGFLANWQGINPTFIREQLTGDYNIRTLDVLDELFFQLKKDRKKEFLNHDACAIILEVDAHAITQA